MSVFSFHLVQTKPAIALGAMWCPPARSEISGLVHAECLASMSLGAPIFSPSRLQMRKLAVFACWENDSALDAFLGGTRLGRTLAEGWYVRLEFLRQWGQFPEFGDLPATVDATNPAEPVVAVTLARLKIPQVSRFIRWGKPV